LAHGVFDPLETSADATATAVCEAKQTSALKSTVPKIEIDDHFAANPLRELCNLGKGLLAFASCSIDACAFS